MWTKRKKIPNQKIKETDDGEDEEKYEPSYAVSWSLNFYTTIETVWCFLSKLKEVPYGPAIALE